MPRLSVVNPETAPGKGKEIFAGPLKGKAFNIFKGMANSPAALDAYVSLSGSLAAGMLSAKEREVVQLAIGEANHCGYCAAAHTAIGQMVGLSADQTIEARRGAMQDGKLDALAKFALRVLQTKGNVSDADLNAFRAAGYADGHVAEVCANIALALYTNFFNHVNDTVSEFPAAPKL